MITQAHIAVRNAGLLMAQKGSHILAGLLFALVVPRLMGPEAFGRYALITSVLIWFALVSGISAAQTMSRFVPQFTVTEDNEGLQKFVGNLLVLRLVNGTIAAALYLLFTHLWFPELDLTTLVIVSVTVFIRSGSKLLFALFLGLNQAARWGMSETLNKWVSLALIVAGFYLGGLRGACFGLLLTELTVLSLGVSWAWSYLSWSKLGLNRKYLAPYLRFSLSFYTSNVLLSISNQGGEMLVRIVSGDYKEVAYFGVAYRMYFLAASAIWQFLMAFNPLLSTFHTQGNTDELRRWVERLLKWLSLGGVFAILGLIFLGDNIVPLAFGADYHQVATNLLPLTLALLTSSLSSMARVLALTYNKPWTALQSAIIQVTSFVGIGMPLVAWKGSLAGCLAVLIASTLYAGYFTWRMNTVIRYSLKQWGLAILLGALFVPLYLLRSTWPINVALFGLSIVGYSSLLLLLRVVTVSEITQMRRVLKPRSVRLSLNQAASDVESGAV